MLLSECEGHSRSGLYLQRPRHSPLLSVTRGPPGGRFEDVTCAVPSSRFTRSHWGAEGGPAPVQGASKGSAGAGAPVRAAEEGLVELQPRTNGCSEREMMFPHARGDPRASQQVRGERK